MQCVVEQVLFTKRRKERVLEQKSIFGIKSRNAPAQYGTVILVEVYANLRVTTYVINEICSNCQTPLKALSSPLIT